MRSKLPDLLVRAAAILGLSVCPSLLASDYAVVVSQSTAADAAWSPVVAALESKHKAEKIFFEKDPAEAVPALKKMRPRYVAFVMPPAECTKEFIVAARQFMRALDDDPYADAFWGVVTGFNAEDALAVVKESSPFVIHKVASATEFSMAHCEEGVAFDELVAGKVVRKAKGGQPVEEKGPADSVKAVVDALNDYKPDLFITSGHASERDWQLGYSYRNGIFHSKAGQMSGRDLQKAEFALQSPNPKVYMPIGNCLMGHIDGSDAMALAWMHSVGVRQMLGYIEPSWFGYMGWGCLDYFVEQPGRYTFTEAFYANEAALIQRLTNLTPAQKGDQRGLEFDRDHVAFYGDPAWDARLAPGPLQWKQTLTEEKGKLVLVVEPLLGGKSFETVNKNGSQRGGRPIVQFLTKRIDPAKAKVSEGADFKPVVTDDFILVPRPEKAEKPIRIVVEGV